MTSSATLRSRAELAEQEALEASISAVQISVISSATSSAICLAEDEEAEEEARAP